jgi:hypothetical protein
MEAFLFFALKKLTGSSVFKTAKKTVYCNGCIPKLIRIDFSLFLSSFKTRSAIDFTGNFPCLYVLLIFDDF